MAKKSTSTKATATKAGKTFSINLQKPGSLPEKMKVAAGTTVKDLSENLNLDGYTISVNGSTASPSTELTKDAVVRIGAKTKNAVR